MWLAAGGALVGLLLRVWMWHQPFHVLHFDEATVAVQARHMLQGHVSPFYWGQPYGGTAETALVAVSLRLFGTRWLALALVPAALHATACLVTWRAGLRILDRSKTVMASVAMWCFSPAFVWLSLREYGFYAMSELLAAALLLWALRVEDAESTRDLACFGFLIGLAVWTSPLLPLVVLPLLVWLAIRRAFHWGWWVTGLAALAGSSPWLGWNVTHHFASVDFTNAFRTSYLARFGTLGHLILYVFGLQAPFTSHRLIPGPWVLSALAVVAIVALGLLRCRPGAHRQLLVTLTLGGMVLWAMNSRAAGAGDDPRYLIVATPLIALLFASALGGISRHSGALALAALIPLSIWGFARFGDSPELSEQYRPGDALDHAIHSLEAHHDRGVFTQAVGWIVMFQTNESVVAESFADSRQASFEALIRRQPRPAYLLQATSDGNDVRLVNYMRDKHIAYTEERFGPWRLLRPAILIPPETVPLFGFLGPVHR